MTAKKYHKKIESIRKRLVLYRPDSVLKNVLDHVHWSDTNKAPALGMPWIVFFLLKLAMQESKGQRREITKGEFSNFANELYHMQALAIPIGQNNPHLVLRPMILQQAWYQGSVQDDIRTLTRQMLWFAKTGSPYAKQFKITYGLSLEHFYLISLYLDICIADKAKGVAVINLFDLIFSLAPEISLDSIVRYFLLVSVRSEDLPGFFMANAVPGDENQQSEFLQTTPLRKKPILLDGDNLFLLGGRLFSRSISVLIPDLLKKMKGWNFKQHFGPDMEAYIASLLNRSGISYLTEAQLNAVCRKSSVVSGKMADYLVPGAVNIIFESKAIEPGDIVTAVFDADLLRSHLQDSFIKAIEQCQESVYRLSLSKDYSGADFACVVVTHQDFWFASAADVASFIDVELEARIVKKFGALPISFDKIIFVTIDMVEAIFDSQARSEINVGDFVAECCRDLATPAGRRFTLTHLIEDKLKDRMHNHPLLIEQADQWFNFFQAAVQKNQSYWVGKHSLLIEQKLAAMSTIRRVFDRLQNL